MKASCLLAALIIATFSQVSLAESPRKVARVLNVGHLAVPLFENNNFESNPLALTYSECKAVLEKSSNVLDDLTYSDDGKCLTLNQSWSGLNGSVCEGDSLNANDNVYKVLEITQTVLGRSNYKKTIECDADSSPLVRVQDKNGTIFSTKSFDLAQLAEINKTKIVKAYGDVCGGAKAMVIKALGKKCAIESATKKLNRTCSQLNGALNQDTIKVLKIRCDMDNATYTPGCAAELEATCNF